MSQATLRAPSACTEIHPDAVAAVRRSGRRPHRVLLFGGGVLRGLGLSDHNLGLPGRLADALVERSGRGADIDVIVDTHPTSPRALEGLHGLRLRRYDAVIVFVGDHHASAALRPDAWRRQMEVLARTLRDEVAPEAPVLLCDSAQAMLAVGADGATSRRTLAGVDRLSAVAAGIVETAGFSAIELAAIGAPTEYGRFSPASYGIWADAIASRVYRKLHALEDSTSPDRPVAFRRRPDPERPRQRALMEMRLHPTNGNATVNLIVWKARIAFQAQTAYLNIIDGDVQRAYASSSGELPVMARELAFCDHTIRSDDLTLVNDAHLDPRFCENPLTQGENPIRFYAGFPIHTWDGYRIGALCIVDSSPRNMMPRGLQTLQDFAGRIEQELWGAALRDTRPAGPVRMGRWI